MSVVDMGTACPGHRSVLCLLALGIMLIIHRTIMHVMLIF